MTKKAGPKKPTAAEIAAQVTPERVEAAAKSGTIARLLKLSKAFTRAASAGPYTIELPILCPVTIEDYGIRQKSIPAGNQLLADQITIGKKGGLIFHFKPKGVIKSDRGDIIHVEMQWGDVDSVLGDLVDKISGYLGGGVEAPQFVEQLESDIKSAVKANVSMHAILSGGFMAAQESDKRASEQDLVHQIPGFGSF